MRPPLRATAKASLAGLLLAAFGAACGESDASLSPLAEQGHTAYRSICITCHNGVPSQDGSLGPAIAGSSRELLAAKVLRGEYPPGYTPKRATNAMPRFEYMADQIDALAAYLAEAKP